MKRLPFCLSFSLSAALATAQSWAQLAPTTSPTTRRSGAMEFALNTGGVLMYGGLQSGPTLNLNETWLWNGADWQQLAPATTPPARWGHRMVYDSRRDRIVTFGGRSPTTTATANDTWEWDGNDWQQVFPAASPNARAFYAMAYDQRRGVTVLYGTQGGGTVTGGNQTWQYDGATWLQVSTPTSPPGVESPGMAYDAGRGVVVMFGGFDGTTGTMHGSTWEFDGVTWTQRNLPTLPPARYRAAMAYDPQRGRTVLYGGFAGGGALQDTWEYDGNTWTQVANGGPVKSTECYMAHDLLSGGMLHFGGSGPTGVSNETWLYTGATTAIAAPFGKGCPTSQGVPVLSPGNTPVLGSSYALDLANGTLTSLALLVYGLENTVFAPGLFLPLDLTFAGIAGCGLETTADALITEVLANGTLSTAFAVPANPGLAGVALFTQALVIDLGAPNGFAGMSNAVHGHLGL